MAEPKQKIKEKKKEEEPAVEEEEEKRGAAALAWPNLGDVQSASSCLHKAFKYVLRGCLGFLGCPCIF